MSSWVLKTYKKDNIYIELEWDKYKPNFKVSVSTKITSCDFYKEIFINRFNTMKEGEDCFKKQVKKYFNEDIEF